MAKPNREYDHDEFGNKVAHVTFLWTVGCAAAFLAVVLYFIFL